MTKRVSYIFAALLSVVMMACQHDVEIIAPEQDATPEGWVKVEFTANAPVMTEVAVRGVDPDGIDIQNLTLFCFNDYGLYITHVEATLNPAIETPSLSGTYEATIPEDTRIIHFVGNQNPNLYEPEMFVNRTEDEIQDDMVGASGMIIYWGRFIFSNEGSLQQQLATVNGGEGIRLIRNQAKITVENPTNEFITISGWTVTNIHAYGTTAPYHPDKRFPTEGTAFVWPGEDFVTLPENRIKLSDITDVTTKPEQYIFEHENTLQDPISIILKGRPTGGSEELYYRVMIIDEMGEQLMVRRNHHYKLNITGKLTYGSRTFEEALLAPATNNIWVAVDDWVNEVSYQGVSLAVDQTNVVLGEDRAGQTLELGYTITGSSTLTSADIAEVSWVDGNHVASHNFNHTFTPNGNEGRGTITIQLHEMGDSAMLEGKLIVKKGRLQRTINIVLIKTQTFTPVWAATQIYGGEIGELATFKFNVPEDFPFFPFNVYVSVNSLDVRTETTSRTLPVVHKIGEKDYADCYISSDLVVNNGGSIIEPKKIKNITATSTNQGVKVSWAADPVADKYRIYRKAEGAKKWTRLDTIEADETSFIDKTAKSGKKYIYTVKGYNFVGWGEFNSKGVTHTYYEAPDVTIKTTTKGVYLKWAKIAGATKYKIYRQTSGSSKWTLLDTIKGTSFTDKTAKSGKKYYYRVRSAKGDIMSGYNVVSKYFLSSPKLSSAKNSASGVKVEWKKVTGAEGYNVYRKSGSGSYKYIGKTSKLYYTDETAKSGTTYTYTVKAYKSKTESSYNSGLKLKYLAAPKVETKVYTSTIKVSWDKVSGAKEYAVYRKASGESKWTKLTTTTKTSYKDANVKNNKTYSYRVKAINGKTVSSYDTVKQLFLSTPKLSSVKNTDNGVKITWKKVSGAEGYKIYRKTGSGSFKLIGTTTNNKTYSYTDKDFEAGKTYTYTVKAYNGKYTGYYNKTGLKITTKAPTIKKPSMNSLTNAENGVQVAWTPVSGADKYYIYRQLDGAEDWERIAIVSEDELSKDQYGYYLLYVDETAENGKIYGYAVRAYDDGFLSDYAYAPNRYMVFLTPVNFISAENTAEGILLEWEANEYADGYVLQRKAEGEEEFRFVSCEPGETPTSAIDTNVLSGKTYTYTIYAQTNKGDGKDGWSAVGGTITVTVE